MIGNHLKADGLPAFIAYAVYIGELIAPLMVIAGVYCRYGAIMIVINMLFAFGLFHMSQFFSLGHSGGWQLELQGFYLFSAAGGHVSGQRPLGDQTRLDINYSEIDVKRQNYRHSHVCRTHLQC